MERRREPRFAMDQEVVVAVLDGREARRAAHVRNASVWGLAIEMTCPVVPGALLRVEFEDGIVAGRVIYCRRAAGSYYVGVALEQALTSLAPLAAVLDAIGQSQEVMAQTP